LPIAKPKRQTIGAWHTLRSQQRRGASP